MQTISFSEIQVHIGIKTFNLVGIVVIAVALVAERLMLLYNCPLTLPHVTMTAKIDLLLKVVFLLTCPILLVIFLH